MAGFFERIGKAMSQQSIEAREGEPDEFPKCPHCKQEIRELRFKRDSGIFVETRTYYCPHPNCKTILSVVVVNNVST